MGKKYDLEERTTVFGKNVVSLCKDLKRNPINDRLVGQAVGACGSIGANYREANDSLGKKDLLQRLRIARREAKESYHWLTLLSVANEKKKMELDVLIKESIELKNIISTIIIKIE